MPQEYGHLANLVPTPEFVCEICGGPAHFSWTDYHGEAYHVRCGAPYQLLQYEPKGPDGKLGKAIDAPPKLKISQTWLPVIKQYWNETHEFMGLGTYMILRDYPECARGRERLDAWLDLHPELIPPEVAAE